MQKKRTKKEKIGRWYLAAVLSLLAICLGSGVAGCKTGQGEKTKQPEQGVTATAVPVVTKQPEATVIADADVTPTSAPETSETEQGAVKRLEKMTLEEKVGQMFLVRCPEAAIESITEYKVGGYVLFARDFEGESKASMQEKLASYQEASDIPLLLSVDEEGGTVVRASKYTAFRSEAFLAPRELYRLGGLERIAEDATEKAELLLSLGINVNLAPVCDISQDPAAFMYARSFGGNAEATAEYVTAVVTAAKKAGLGSVLKHFPGYGDNADTHQGLVWDTRAYEAYTENDFLPFVAGIEAGAGAVMVSHNIVECMDPELPASLSDEVHRILREELAFDGVILTDDLYMDAIQDFTGTEAAAVAAVLAGNDMLCCTDFEVQIPAVIEAVKDGRISEEQIDASVLRILKWKAELGIVNE